jgi:hypothetical protein
MANYYEVVTDGNVFRITKRSFGGDDKFVCDLLSGEPLEFHNKEAAEAYIHNKLSMSGWRKA